MKGYWRGSINANCPETLWIDMRVAYVGCARSLTTNQQRRDDAYEHDREVLATRPAFDRRGDTLIELDWRRLALESETPDLFFLRTVWDYTEHQAEFVQFLDDAGPTM
jgi:hypothetical protein